MITVSFGAPLASPPHAATLPGLAWTSSLGERAFGCGRSVSRGKEPPRGRLFRAQPMDLCSIRTCLLLRLRSSVSPPRSHHDPLHLRDLPVLV